MNGPRRTVLRGAAALAAAPWLAACTERSTTPAPHDGAFVGASPERAHRLREARPGAAPDVVRRVGCIVVGAGIAGLAAARALDAAGIDDTVVLELDDVAGGMSRGHAIAGMRCPLGAHYLPLPGERALEVIELLEALGLRTPARVGGDARYDERALCHSPQERLFIDGAWHDGLLPPIEALPAAERAPTLAQYRRFAAAVREASTPDAFAIPTARSRWDDTLAGLDAVTFAGWLDGRGFDAPALRWYLDHCCRDDYGAGASVVSAWAGLHYFASRHGFDAPDDDRGRAEGVLVWPEGNAFLAERLAAPLGTRLHTGRVVVAVEESAHGVAVDAVDAASGRRERWLAAQAISAVPLFVARRLLASAPPALVAAADALPRAPWLVANIHVERPLVERDGAGPAWDSVVHRAGDGFLGYVDAMHQSMRPHAGPTVLTAYWAPGDAAGSNAAARRSMLADDWATTARRVMAALSALHPDLPAKTRRIDLARHGHAMAIPVPGARSSAALAALAAPRARIHFAHADLSAYSVFEEALFHGTRAGRAVQSGFRIRAPRRLAP